MSSNTVLPEKIEEIVNAIAVNEGYVTFDVKITPLDVNSASYLSILYEATIKGETEKISKETNLFIKYPIPKENLLVDMEKAFTSEMFFYNELSKMYNQLQDEVKISDKDKYPVPKSYLCNANTIILENIKKNGFINYNTTDVVSLEYAEMCIKHLAQFHALSFVLEKKHPDYFKNKQIADLRMPFDWNEMLKNYYFKMSNLVLYNLRGELKEKLQITLTDIFKKFVELLEYTDREHCCVCHGDYRAANVLALEINGELTNIMPVDYQLLHYSNPSSDIIFFLTICTDKKFRKAHQENLKQLYHNALSKFLEKFDLNAETVYSKAIFEKAFKDFSVYSVVILILSMPYMYVYEDQVPTFGNPEKCNLKPLFAERAYEILEEYFV